MKHLIFSLFALMFAFSALAQEQTFEAPNFEVIKKTIQTDTSRFFYPRLLERYQAMDSSLNADDYKHLYYGFVFNAGYQPYKVLPEDKQLSDYFKRDELAEADYDKIIQLAKVCLKQFPFNINQMKMMAFAYNKKGDSDTSAKLMGQTFDIIKTIMQSGDGKSEATAYHVISVGNEYDLLRMLNLQSESQTLIGNCDKLILEKNSRGLTDIFFNVEQPLLSLKKK